ncbi:type II toxin-antitoxin system HicA family toxin [Campylobacter curvus]|uniref:Toxin-antitoxin system, toxin component, HicA family n=1 Tax=Campylobacter curvus (strain 525.92) TaxID=360105 RepID=A7GY92_CAMC5|nr:type II toxin-antitoxin system HicA family toxin [Campylobacter curvus]EAT99692.1 putative protein, YcfA family [Campylobacter curvus 525.92]
MSKRDKLIQELENNPKNVRFEVLKNLLESDGWEALNNGSSHWQFRKGGERITVPYKRPVKPLYVKNVLKALKDEK